MGNQSPESPDPQQSEDNRPPKHDTQPPKVQSETSPPTKGLGWVAAVPKFAVVVGFIAYVFGFVIWYAHLTQYGLGLPNLWRVEFISASLCYFVIVFSIAFPVALLWGRIVPPPDWTDFMQARSVALYPLLILWAFLLTQIGRLFFVTSTAALPSPLTWPLLAVLVVHLATSIVLIFRKEEGRLAMILRNETWFGVYLILFSILYLWRSERADRGFLLSTALLYLSVIVVTGLPLEKYWRTFSPHLKLLSLACAALLLFNNAREFGARQFGKIPQSVGGGEPLQALLVFGKEQEGLARLLGIPMFQLTNPPVSLAAPAISTNAVSTSSVTNAQSAGALPQQLGPAQNLYGPVAVLMKSEKELAFFLPAAAGRGSQASHAKLIRTDQLLAIEFLHARW